MIHLMGFNDPEGRGLDVQSPILAAMREVDEVHFFIPVDPENSNEEVSESILVQCCTTCQ